MGNDLVGGIYVVQAKKQPATHRAPTSRRFWARLQRARVKRL
jgi:hypothetical protein